MEDNIQRPENEQPKGVKFNREARLDTNETHMLKGKFIEVGERMKPFGTVCVGFATVFYYENDQNITGDPGGSYLSFTAIGNLNEYFADRGIKELAIHCKKMFGHSHKDPRA